MADLETVARRLAADVPDLLTEHRVPGAAIGVCDASGLRWSRAFGTTRAGGGHPVTPRTMFSLQSVSKLYTATTVMLAVQDGRIDLDVPIPTYIPGFTVNSGWESHPERKITLRHLLSHTAGFTHEAPIGGNYLPGRSWAEHCRSISDTWLRFPVGHHYEYSNVGIDLAAYALQLVTGMPFHAYARQRLLEPLGLDRTTFDQRAISAERDRAIGHDSQVKRLPVWIPMVAAGGLYASVEDACRFVQFHLANGENLLAPEHLATMYSVPFPEPQQDLGYGLGTAYLRWDGRVIRGHGGGGFGFSCNVVWSPEDAIGVVILTNGDAFQPSAEVPRRFFRELLGAASEDGVVGEGATPSFDGSFVGRGGSTPAGSDPRARFRVDGDYLVRNDGFTFYRNEVSEFPADARPDGVWNRGYVTTIAGTRLEQVRLLRAGDRASIEFVEMGLRLALTRKHDLLYFCSMGEALDLSRTPITYGNVPLSIDREQRR